MRQLLIAANNTPLSNITYTENTDSHNIEFLPTTSNAAATRKKVRTLKPGEYPPPKNVSEKTRHKENKRQVKVLFPSTSRKICCFVCHLCKRDSLSLTDMIKCNVCKNWICLSCSGTDFFDYICSICLDPDD
ncbi:unnamed protein product [Parnassius mnemosyne]|uniref:Uncharacterized protein n=1 Tax=Parnassius mnemosyne TaxID=213953 RepID=A0AAV1L9T0_9NEOP